MFLNSNNRKIIETLRDKNLNFLVKPFKDLIQLEQDHKIKIHKMSWKVIMRNIHSGSRSEIRETLTSYLDDFAVSYKLPNVVNVPSKDRVKKHRSEKKKLGYKTVCIDLDRETYDRLQREKKKYNLTYPDLVKKLMGY